jgi:hypothetical protein
MPVVAIVSTDQGEPAILELPAEIPPPPAYRYEWKPIGKQGRTLWYGQCGADCSFTAACDESKLHWELAGGGGAELKAFDQPPAQGSSVSLSSGNVVATVFGKCQCGHDNPQVATADIYSCERTQ